MHRTITAAALIASATSFSSAGIYVTELMYSGGGDEFVEFTNTGPGAIDVTGWTYQTASAGSYDMSAFGAIDSGESVIITQGDASFFRDTWGLDASVKVIGGYENTLARNDTITILDASSAIVDVLAYGDGDFDGSVRPRENTANVATEALGANDAYALVASFHGDVFGSWSSTEFDLGNPGSYPSVPAPSALLTLGAGLAAASRRRRSA